MDSGHRKNERDFFLIASIGTCIGFAFMGVVFSSFDPSQNPSFKWTLGTAFWGILGGVSGWLFWQMAKFLSDRAEAGRLRHQSPGRPAHHYFLGFCVVFFVLAATTILPEKWRPAAAGIASCCFMVAVVFYLMKQMTEDQPEDE